MAITDPTDISKCIGWYDPNVGAPTLEGGAGSRVASIPDNSGLGHTFSIFSGAGPLIASANLNGKDVLDCHTSAGFLDANSDIYSGLTSGEGIIYAKAVGGEGLWGGGRAFAPTRFPSSFDGHVNDEWGSTVLHDAGTPAVALTSWRVYSVVSKSGEWTCRLDNSVQFTTATNTVSFNPAMRVGRSYSSNFDGYIGAWYFFNAELTSTERSDMYDYITNVAFAPAAPASSGNTFRVSGIIG